MGPMTSSHQLSVCHTSHRGSLHPAPFSLTLKGRRNILTIQRQSSQLLDIHDMKGRPLIQPKRISMRPTNDKLSASESPVVPKTGKSFKAVNFYLRRSLNEGFQKAFETEQNKLAIGRDQQGAKEVISLLKEKDERIKNLEDSQLAPIFPITHHMLALQ